MRQHCWLTVACVLAGAASGAGQEIPVLADGAVARLGTPRLRVTEHISDTGFAPDGRTLVVIAGKEGKWSAVLFDVATGIERKRIGLRDYHNVAVARHKPLLAVEGHKGFEVWDLATDKLVKQWPQPASGWTIKALAISPNGAEVVAAVSQKEKHAVWRWDATSGKALPERFATTGPVRTLSFSADGGKLLTASEDKVVRVNEKFTTIPGSIIAWDRKTGKKLAELPTVYPNIQFAPDGTRFARGTTGKGLEIIDIGTGKRLAEFAEPHAEFSFTPDSKRLVIVSGGAIRLWDIDASKDAGPIEGKPQARSMRPSFSVDGRLLAVTQYDASANFVQFWDVATGKPIRFETGHPGTVEGLAYSPDGRQLASFSEDTLLIFDARTGKELHRWVGHKREISRIAFSPDGKLLASAAFGGSIALWDPATAKLRHRLNVKSYGRTLTFTRDGATLLAVNTDRAVQSWDVATGALLETHEVPMKTSLSISPAGQLAGLAGRDFTTLQFMNARTGKRMPSIDLRRNPDPKDAEYGGLIFPEFAFSADGRLLATSDSMKMHDHVVRVWETASRREILRVAGIHNSTRLLAISPDGRILAHGFHAEFTWGGHGHDKTVLLRDISNTQSVTVKGKEADAFQKLQRPIGGQHGSIRCLAFSPDSKFLATGGTDRVVTIWRVADFFKRPVVPGLKGDVAALWPQLADADAGKAYQAIAQLETRPTEAVALLRQHLQPVPTADKKVVAQHLRDLSSASFAVRQQALAALEKSGEQSAHFLQEALKNPANLEVKRRLQTLLEKLDQPLEPGQIRVQRCLVLLVRIGTPDAQKLLLELSQGAPDAWLTTEARLSLKRFAGR